MQLIERPAARYRAHCDVIDWGCLMLVRLLGPVVYQSIMDMVLALLPPPPRELPTHSLVLKPAMKLARCLPASWPVRCVVACAPARPRATFTSLTLLPLVSMCQEVSIQKKTPREESPDCEVRAPARAGPLSSMRPIVFLC